MVLTLADVDTEEEISVPGVAVVLCELLFLNSSVILFVSDKSQGTTLLPGSVTSLGVEVTRTRCLSRTKLRLGRWTPMRTRWC